MIIIRLKGGMGNQMFQYAFGLKLASQLQTDLVIDLSTLLDRSRGDYVYRNYDLSIFNVDPAFTVSPTFLKTIYQLHLPVVTRAVRRYVGMGKKYVKESHFHFRPELLAKPANHAIYEGWFQSPSYFQGIEEQVRAAFTFQEPVLDTSRDLLDRINSNQSVCLNVRRTDFLKVDNLNTTDKTYFFTAADYLAAQVENPVFFVFSDDVAWCREHIQLEYPVEVVGHEHKGEKFGNYLQLMKACKHFIIPNSSFAWWAAWLNQYPDKKVVAPKQWFKDPAIDTSDLIPSEWERL